MDRRRLFTVGAAALTLAAPWVARAASRPVVAILRGNPWAPPSLRDFLIYGMREQGLEEGRDFDIVYRSADSDPARIPALVAEIVALEPAVIISQTTELTVQLHRATRTIPIVATAITDPIGFGLVDSIAHPGGNVTGLLSTSARTGKQFEILQQVVPGLGKAGLLLNPSNPAHKGLGANKSVAEAASLGITIVAAWAKIVAEIDGAMKLLADEGVGAVVVGQDALFNQEAKRIAELALAARLPTAYGFRNLADAGGLISYGGSLTDRWRRGGWYAAKILKGEKAGDLPVEQQEKLELVINMKTAKALGLTIPPLVLTRADDLIE